jgi:hypothetical protein
VTHHRPTDDAAAAARRIRVVAVADGKASVQAAYVQAVLPPEAVIVGPATPQHWLDPEYLGAHAGDVDVLHLHDPPAGLSLPELEGWTETVRRLGIPLVVTVHQLQGPECGTTGGRYDAALATLLSTAEVVLSLTTGAADEIAERFGRTPIVVAHPSIATPVPDVGAERGLVGLVLGRRAAAVADPVSLARAALSGAISGGGRLRVIAEPWVVGPALRRLAEERDVELAVHPGPPAEDWPAQLQQLHVAVLPERCGTHSPDLEICRDVGTRVVAPSCGWFADQWSDVVTYADDEEHGFDPVSLTAAVAAALTRPAPRPADREWRTEQRAAVQRVHAEVYARVAADRCRV